MNDTTAISCPAGISDCLPDVGAYFVCLAAYNNGHRHGAWVDLEVATSTEEIKKCIDWILAGSPVSGAEEWAMHGYANLPVCLSCTDWPDLADLASYGEALAEIGDDPVDREAFRFYCDDRGEVCSIDDFRSAYQGRWEDPAHFAYQLAEERGLVPETSAWPLSCIDWGRAWQELKTNGGYRSVAASDGGVHIFRSY